MTFVNRSVFIVDDHDKLRQLIVGFVAELSGFSVTGQAASAEAALADPLINKADIVLTDLSMPGMSGIELTRKLIAQNKTRQVVLLSAHDDSFYAEAAFKAGASAFVVKDDPSLIMTALERVSAGERGFTETEG